jgi:hypothetical protein
VHHNLLSDIGSRVQSPASGTPRKKVCRRNFKAACCICQRMGAECLIWPFGSVSRKWEWRVQTFEARLIYVPCLDVRSKQIICLVVLLSKHTVAVTKHFTFKSLQNYWTLDNFEHYISTKSSETFALLLIFFLSLIYSWSLQIREPYMYYSNLKFFDAPVVTWM